MQKIYIVEVDKSFSEHSEKLMQLMSEQGIEVDLLSFEQYKNLESLSDIIFDGAKFIFVGTNSSGQCAVPSITTWKYERFACRIGWKGNKCVVFARSSDLPYSDYKAFRNYCQGMKLDEYSDIIIPPENPFAEGFEEIKKTFAKKKNQSVHRAQYSTLLYELMNNYFGDFLNCESSCANDTDDSQVPPDIKDILQNRKARALSNLTWKQAALCHAIIHTATVACATVAFLPIPAADTIPITSAQIAMVIGLGKVFDNKLTKSDAQILLKTVVAPLVGRAFAKNALVFVPGVGWAINSAIAAAITEILGWTIVNDFAKKS